MTVAYYRNSISKEKQKLSIIMQRDHVHQLAQNKRLLIDAEYSDDETSARKTETNERKQMTKLLREIEKGNVKTLLVYSRCRIARNVHQYMKIYRTFKEHDIEVIFAAEHEFPMIYTIEGEFIERIMAAFNQHEAENLVKKLRDAKLTKARKGLHAVASITFGYEANSEVDGDWKIVEEEAETIRKIYRLFLEGEFKSFNQLVKVVNEQGFLFKGKEWLYGNVRNLFKNKIYIGFREYKDKEELISVSVPHLQIIDHNTWEQAQIRMQQYSREIIEEEEPMSFLLKDLIECFECKQKVKGKKIKRMGTTIGVYQCENCKIVKFGKDILEQEVINQANKFFNEILSPMFKNFLSRVVDEQASIHKKLEQKLDRVGARLKDEIAQELDILLEIDDVSDLPETVIKLHQELEKVVGSFNSMKDKWFETIETLKELNTFHDDFQESIQIIEAEMEETVIKELLEDIIQGIYAMSQNEVQIIFKHPHIEGVGGREIIEFA